MRRIAGRDAVSEPSPLVAAIQADRGLLISRQGKRIFQAVHCANHKAAIVTPREIGPPAILCFLIMEVHVLLINLVVILTVGAYRQVRVENDAAVFRAKEPGVRMTHRRVNSQAADIDSADARGHTVQLRMHCACTCGSNSHPSESTCRDSAGYRRRTDSACRAKSAAVRLFL